MNIATTNFTTEDVLNAWDAATPEERREIMNGLMTREGTPATSPSVNPEHAFSNEEAARAAAQVPPVTRVPSAAYLPTPPPGYQYVPIANHIIQPTRVQGAAAGLATAITRTAIRTVESVAGIGVGTIQGVGRGFKSEFGPQVAFLQRKLNAAAASGNQEPTMQEYALVRLP